MRDSLCPSARDLDHESDFTFRRVFRIVQRDLIVLSAGITLHYLLFFSLSYSIILYKNDMSMSQDDNQPMESPVARKRTRGERDGGDGGDEEAWLRQLTPYGKIFWTTVESLAPPDKRALLRFITGRPYLPLKGEEEVL